MAEVHDEAPAQGRFLGWITRLVHDHRAALVAAARHEGLGPEEALDTAQEAFHAFLLLPQARLLVEQQEDSAKLLAVLARNIARNLRKRHHRARPHEDAAALELPDLQEPPDTLVARAESYVAAVGCLATLGQVQKAVVELRLVDDTPTEDVAAMLGTTPSNVAVLLHRAKAKLRTCVPQ